MMDIFVLVLKTSIIAICLINYVIWQMMLYKNLGVIMENMRQEIKYPSKNSKDI